MKGAFPRPQRKPVALAGLVLPLLLLLLATAPLASPAPAYAEPAPSGGTIPTRITIPRLQVDARVLPLGMDDEGAMAAPTDPDVVGWYELGPGFDTPGNAILDGHVDWAGRLRAFGYLRDLGPGDRIWLADEAGLEAAYTVVSNDLLDANTTDVESVFSQDGPEAITLITCGGEFDHASHQYLSRVVVRALRDDAGALVPW